jgi:hypothetical protein
MLPQVLQKDEYGTPVAALSLDGLLVTCFNRDSKNWEIALIRGGHELELVARSVNLKTGEIVAQSAFGPIREDAKLIQFKVTRGSENHLKEFERGYFFFKDKPRFDRTKEDDSIDYRWVVDAMTDIPHGNFVEVKKPKDEVITLVTVPNALFYTKRVTQDTVFFAPDGSDPANDPAKFIFGRMNELIGAALYASDPHDIEITYADTGEPVFPDFPMPFKDGFFYDISLMNRDPQGGGATHASVGAAYSEGDFLEMYELFKFDTDKKFQVFAPLAVDDNANSDEVDCHGTDVGSKGGTAPNSLMSLIA